MREHSVAGRLCHFISRSFLGEGAVIERDTRLIDLHVLDSAAVFDVVDFIRSEFGIQVPPADIHPTNFDCVESLARLVHRLSTETGGRNA